MLIYILLIGEKKYFNEKRNIYNRDVYIGKEIILLLKRKREERRIRKGEKFTFNLINGASANASP